MALSREESGAGVDTGGSGVVSSATDTESRASPSTARRWTILAVCASALFLVGLDTSIVTVGLSEIGAGLDVAPDRLSWVIDSYTVVFASFLITSGALADRFGRRRTLLVGMLVFGLSSVLCAVAPSFGVLIAARIAQGVGASMLTPVGLAIVVNTMTDPAERARAIGVWGSMFGLSLAAGPVTGGALIAALDWRALFWINIPCVAVAMILIVRIVPESHGGQVRRLDVPGQALLVAILAIAVALIIEVPRIGWSNPLSLTGYVTLAGLLPLFVVVESRRHQPVIEPALFRVAAFRGAVLGALAVFVAFSMTLLTTTVYLQDVRGWTAVAVGAAILPMAAGAICCAPLSGYLVSRIGPRVPLMIAGAAIVLGGILLTGVPVSDSIGLLIVAYLFIGVGVGFANAPITNTAVSSLPPARAGVAGGTASTARQVGISVGIALAGSLVSGADDFTSASVPAWITIALCGAVVVMLGVVNRRPG
ncbi:MULTISPECIES: MFS transporter [Gordonia]|uniref:MFS transporter n=1 Tax=Gordonia TaxID=2053 RepID=UPI001FE97B77|nr:MULTISPECIES: MFS transporter [Gordonia]